MKDTTLKTLGTLAIVLATGEPQTHFRTQKCGELLGLLVRHKSHPAHREALGEWLWPGEDSKLQRNRLRYELCQLRSLLPPAVLHTQGHHLIRLTAPSDYSQFEQLAHAGLTASSPAQRVPLLLAALSHYQGEFLPNYYTDWVLQERRYLETLHTTLLKRLRTDLRSLGQSELADYGSLKHSH